MLRLHNIKLPLSYSGQSLAQAAAKALGVSQSAVAHCEISRKSVDARKKNDVCFVVALIKPHGVEALADDIRQSLLTHVFGCTGSLHPFTKLNHNGTSIGIFVHYLDDVL